MAGRWACSVGAHRSQRRRSVFALLSRGTPRYNGNVFSSNVLFVMSLMEESANAELQGRPGGARRCARSAAGHGRENLGRVRGREGDATRGPGSTSTHLNFGPSQGQCGRTIRARLSLFFLLLRHLVWFLFFLFARLILSVSLFLARSVSLRHPCLPSTGFVPHYRVIPCQDPRPLPCRRKCFFSFFFSHGPTYDPAKSQLVEILV